MILNECISRVIKNIMEKRMRSLNQASQRLALETTFKRGLVEMFNIIFAERGHKYGDHFWKNDLKNHIENSFPGALSVKEIETNYDLRDSLSSCSNLLERIIQLTGIAFDPSIQNELQSSNFQNGLEFLEVDILKLPEKTKHM